MRASFGRSRSNVRLRRIKTMPGRQVLRRALITGSLILFPIAIFYFCPSLIINEGQSND